MATYSRHDALNGFIPDDLITALDSSDLAA